MRRIELAAIAVLALCAGASKAQTGHDIEATAGPGCSEGSEELDVDLVDALCDSGVIGVDPNSFANTASVNSATGDLGITSQLSYEEGPGSFDPGAIDTVARIQERLTRTAPGPIRATLQFAPGVDAGGAVVDYEVTLRLTNSCTASFSQSVGNGFVNDPSTTASCPAGTADADVNTLTVTLDSAATDLLLLAQVRAEWLFAFDLGGQYQIDGDLRVEALDGASFTAPSPGFLTQVPEPAGVAAGSVACVVLGAIVRRRSG